MNCLRLKVRRVSVQLRRLRLGMARWEAVVVDTAGVAEPAADGVSSGHIRAAGRERDAATPSRPRWGCASRVTSRRRCRASYAAAGAPLPNTILRAENGAFGVRPQRVQPLTCLCL